MRSGAPRRATTGEGSPPFRQSLVRCLESAAPVLNPAAVSTQANPIPPASSGSPEEPSRTDAPPANPKPAVEKAAAKAKPPAPEDQPFDTFIPQVLLPALAKEVQSYGGPAPELAFCQGAMPVVGCTCWMVTGALPGERRFWLCFTQPDITSAKTIALAEAGANPSLLESFLIDEKKMTLALLVSRLVQRLNGQKWLGPN